MGERKIKYPIFVDEERIEIENYGYDNDDFRFLLRVPFKSGGFNYLRVIMKNPSVANEEKCDMTMRKVCNAAYEADYDGVIVMNLFPFRSKKAKCVYEKFYLNNKELFKKAIAKNKIIIKEVCTDQNVVFAWGTNTIQKTKEFDEFYDTMAHDVIEIVRKCAAGAGAPRLDKSLKYPIHALRWHKEILTEGGGFPPPKYEFDEKHPVLHRNMFGTTAEVCNTNPKDLEIYCYRKGEICLPVCEGCKHWRGDEGGLGRDCEWNDFDGNISSYESVIQNYEKYSEYDRAQYAKKMTSKKDLDSYIDWIKNYEK